MIAMVDQAACIRGHGSEPLYNGIMPIQCFITCSPWLSGTRLIVAVNAPQFFGSQTCGMCLAYKGLGPGAGGILPHYKLPYTAMVSMRSVLTEALFIDVCVYILHDTP